MVLLAGSTGLRRSEMFAFRWRDVNFSTLEVQVLRAVVRNHVGKVKTPASKKPVPLHPSVADELVRWRRESAYNTDDDFLFPSVRLNGQKPVSPDTVLKKIIRPALKAAGITGKVIGWHSFRHSLATNLRESRCGREGRAGAIATRQQQNHDGRLYAGCECGETKR